MPSAIDFISAPNEEIINFTIQNVDEFDEVESDPDFSQNVLASLANGRAVIERRPYGYAVLHLGVFFGLRKMTVLECFYVCSETREQGLGAQFLTELQQTYCNSHGMQLGCYKTWRKDYFSKAGFIVVNQEGNFFEMTYHRPV